MFWTNGDEVFSLCNFVDDSNEVKLMLSEGIWTKILESLSKRRGDNRALEEQGINSRGSGIVIRVNDGGSALYRMIGRGW